MKIFEKLLKSTAREDFSEMSTSKQLQSVRDEVEKVKDKKIELARCKG